MRLSTGLAALAVFVGLVVAAPVPAQADPFGPAAGLWYTDNAGLTYCFTGPFQPFGAVATYAHNNMVNTTDIFNNTPPGLCVFRETDVWWWSVNLAAGIRGQMSCPAPAPWDDDICTSHNVEIDFAELDKGNFDWEDRRKTACHELGHVVGLPHGTAEGAGSCMISGEIPGPSPEYREYNDHHIDHINAHY